jgi:hypothetical protein
MRAPEERLAIAQKELERAFSLINDLWTNQELGLVITLPTHTENQIAVRNLIVDTRIAIMKASNQVEMLINKD